MEKSLALVDLIYEIGLMAHRSHDLESVLQSISERILQITGASFASVALVDEALKEAVLTVGVLRKKGIVPLGFRQPIDKGIIGKVVRTGQYICCEDTGRSAEYLNVVPNMRSELVVPLSFGGRTIGALNVESDRLAQFGATDIALLQAIANPVALAIENARLFQEERKRHMHMAMLNQLNQVLTSTIDLDTLLGRVVETIRIQLDYSFVAIGLLDENNKVVLKAVNSIHPVDLPIGHAQDIGEGVMGEVVATGKSILVTDVRGRPNYIPVHKDFRCEMCSPLRIGSRVIGCLDVESLKPANFDKDDLLMFETVADHIAQAIENAETLRRVTKLREHLSRMIIHDLRNPLSVIASSLEFLDVQKTGLPDAKKRKYLEVARASCDDIFALLDALLELQRIEAGKLELNREVLDPSEILQHIFPRLQVRAEVAGRSLTCEICDHPPKVEVDRNLFSRVLQNLVMNALKFTEKGGHIHISIQLAADSLVWKHLKTAAHGVLFSVQDDGCGIPANELETIFEKFVTLESHSHSAQRGAGLGLTFCREIALAHNGAIWVESQPGKGSTFYVLLPPAHES